ncbi:MAG: hypothetical protein RBT06_05805 [Smithellaceae bacterium]|jgi:hypothetical protein|nr:hypothetical protein [Smithellaceae bacterium]
MKPYKIYSACFIVTTILAAITGYWRLIIYGVVAVPLTIFMLKFYGTIVDLCAMKRSKKVFRNLIDQGYKPFDALVEVSRNRHPELKPETHTKIVESFPDLYKFLGFMAQAADFGKKVKLEDDHVLILLQTTSLTYIGNDVYTAQVDWEAYKKIRYQNS